ncbi:unnamed protein product [Linum trigynum]|uniref:Secreted protein n=1 Tax=Linum trigynum TaxID=586398 RepID=A0AAV2E9E7_9ROSI
MVPLPRKRRRRGALVVLVVRQCDAHASDESEYANGRLSLEEAAVNGRLSKRFPRTEILGLGSSLTTRVAIDRRKSAKSARDGDDERQLGIER